MILFFVGLILGAFAVVAVEAAALFYVINRLNKKTKASVSSLAADSTTELLNPQQSLDFAYSKRGFVWVLEAEKVPKDKVPKEQKKKKEYLEAYPVRKYAKIKDRALILSNSDGSQTAVLLKGCIIEAVSATDLSSRKWAKRFPIKVENKTSVLYHGSNVIYIYLETSWEKESWCKSLRLASCDDKEKLCWFTKLNEEFKGYLASLNAGYPSFMKPSMMLAGSPSVGLITEPLDRASKFDVSSSKVRLFWNKLAKKASKSYIESKARGSSYSSREERKIYEKLRPSQESVLGSSSVKSGTTKMPNNSGVEIAEPLPSTLTRSKSQSQLSAVSDADPDDRIIIDEATLCWNLLIFRLFFDAKNNVGMKNSIQARIQRTLSNMRIPSYIGEIICTDIDTGNVPPYVHCMRVLPTDMNEVWAFEVDIQYAGGVVLDVGTRLEVHELDVQKGIIDANSESTSVGHVSSDLLEEFEYFGKQLNIPEGTIDGQVQKDEGDHKLDGSKNYKSTATASTVSRWKCILNSIAKHVSQVPISLSIRVASLRGTVRLHIKPPSSDQVWFGFTSMPDIEFNLESSVGDRKITSGHIALFLINRFKASIRETLVLPNCESVCIPWMLAEKEDWVPRNVAPFMWLGQEANTDHTTASEAFSSQSAEAKTKPEVARATLIDRPEHKLQNTENLDCTQQPNAVSRAASIPSTSTSTPTIQNINTVSKTALTPLASTSPTPIQNSKSLKELRTPLLAIDGPQETCRDNKDEISECGSTYTSLIQLEKQNIAIEDDDSRPKKMGRRARMLDLGKKMGEKFEEKKRHIEEKSRNIVEKMRGP